MTTHPGIRSVILAATAVTLAATACSSSKSTGSTGGKKHYSVVFIETNTGNPYNDNLAAGFKKAADALGFTLTVTGPSAAGASAQIANIQQAIVGVDGDRIDVFDDGLLDVGDLR